MAFLRQGRQEPIVLFAYDFPHRKTTEFLKELKFLGFTEIVVIAAPKVELGNDSETYFEPIRLGGGAENTMDVCERLCYSYYRCNHDDLHQIREIVDRHKVRFGIISGARILRGSIIDVFSDGVLNFHPGMIPETSGLDSLFYTIQKGATAGVTVHFIDSRVDAGLLWKFEPVTLGLNDVPGVVSERLFWKQIELLRGFLAEATEGVIRTHQINRPRKNPPMASLSKHRCIMDFRVWLSSEVLRQKRERVYSACASDNVALLQLESGFGSMINQPLKEQWPPLVVAAFNHSINCVAWLIDEGADVNYANSHGTTVLMYAKTKYLDMNGSDYPLLKLLIEAGANVLTTDRYGKTVIDYCIEHNDKRLANFFRGYVS